MHCSPIEWSNREEVSVAIFWARYGHGRVKSRQKLNTQTWIVGDEKGLMLNQEILIEDAVDAEVNVVEVEIKTVKKRGILCCAEHVTVAATGITLHLSEENTTLERDCILSVFNEQSKTFSDMANGVRLRGEVTVVKSGEKRDTNLGILAGTFYDAVMPETVESMWGPVPMKRLPDGKENKCKAVVHRYKTIQNITPC